MRFSSLRNNHHFKATVVPLHMFLKYFSHAARLCCSFLLERNNVLAKGGLVRGMKEDVNISSRKANLTYYIILCTIM